MPVAPYIDTHRISELALSLRLQGRGSEQECQKLAAKIVARQQREQTKATGHTHAGRLTAHSGVDWVISKVLRMAANATATAKLMRKKSTPAPAPITPRIIDAPIECSEPVAPTNNIIPLRQKAAPLIIADHSSAQIIPNELYPARYIDRTTEAWKASIRHNKELAKYREQQSALHRAKVKSSYVG
jgi:hypothetical protein